MQASYKGWSRKELLHVAYDKVHLCCCDDANQNLLTCGATAIVVAKMATIPLAFDATDTSFRRKYRLLTPYFFMLMSSGHTSNYSLDKELSCGLCD